MKTDSIRLQRQPLSESTVHGRQSLVSGLVLLAMAGGIAFMAFGGEVYEAEMPPMMIVGLIVVVALAGVAFVGNGLRGLARQRRVEAARLRRPDEPWRWDFPWETTVARDRTGGDAARALRIAIIGAIFLAPFHWIGIYGGGGTAWLVIVGVLDAALLGLGLYGLFLLARRFRYRDIRLRWTTHPFLLGRELTVDLVGLPRDLGAITATLRCIEEKYERRGSSGQGQRAIVCYQLYADERTATADGSSVRFTFPLPDDDLETRLRDRPPRYWELDAHARVPGVDLRSRFLVPVYGEKGRVTSPVAGAPSSARST